MSIQYLGTMWIDFLIWWKLAGCTYNWTLDFHNMRHLHPPSILRISEDTGRPRVFENSQKFIKPHQRSKLAITTREDIKLPS